MRDDRNLEDKDAESIGEPRIPYQAPRVTPIGNLRDLLAGTGTEPCDSTIPAAGPDPASVCN